MSPYASALATARLDAIRTLVDALNEAESPEEKRRCAVAIFNAPAPFDLDDATESVEDEESADDNQNPDETSNDRTALRKPEPSATANQMSEIPASLVASTTPPVPVSAASPTCRLPIHPRRPQPPLQQQPAQRPSPALESSHRSSCNEHACPESWPEQPESCGTRGRDT